MVAGGSIDRTATSFLSRPIKGAGGQHTWRAAGNGISAESAIRNHGKAAAIKQSSTQPASAAASSAAIPWGATISRHCHVVTDRAIDKAQLVGVRIQTGSARAPAIAPVS